ncbi:MAG: peptidylprolyl isomerase [Myxococcota bacterium]
MARPPNSKPGKSNSKPPPEKMAQRSVANVGDALRRMLHNAPALQSAPDQPVALPEVEAPSLEGLEVTVPAPEPISSDELLERWLQIRRRHAQTRDRAEGEPLAAGDEALVDIMAYVGGRILPFSTRADVWLPLDPDPLLPGLSEGLVGLAVGKSKVVPVLIPQSYPAVNMRGQNAVFAVTIKAARQVTLPDETSPDFLQQLNRGATMDEVMDSIRDELEEEKAEELHDLGKNMVLDQLVSRTNVTVPDKLVDEEIRRRWTQSEGKALAARGLTFQEQEEALKGWLSDDTTRADARRRVAIALVLGAVAKRDGLLEQASLDEFMSSYAEETGLPRAEVEEAFKNDAALRAQAAHIVAVEHVLTQARINFEGANPG